MNNNLSDLHRLTDAVRQASVDIAPTYREYVQLAFAIATDCGEAGRSDFLLLCSQSSKYDERAANRLFGNALKNNKNDVHLGTAFHLAELCNVKPEYAERKTPRVGTLGTQQTPYNQISPARACAYSNVENAEPPTSADENLQEENSREETIPGSEPLSPLPYFSDRTHWPAPLPQIIERGTTRAQRDVLLLGAITVLGSAIERHVQCPYGGKMVSPCLQTFVVAPPASGKGVLSFVRMLVDPIHDEIRGQVEEEMKKYRQDKAAYEILGKERAKATQPVMPPNRMFLISGNNTGTGILQNIMDSDGTGLIFETEADTISTAIGSKYGHWSDTMRKAFDHERLSYNRRTEHEYREVKRMYLSVLISGTPAQVKPLIPTAENGLFSRQIYYYMPAIRKWQNQFDLRNTNLEEVFAAMGRQWKEKLQVLVQSGLYTLCLTERQKEEFNNLFANLFIRSGLANGDEMSSSVARLAINLCRIMEVVAILRVLEAETPASSPFVKPDDEIPTDNLKDGIITRWDLSISPDDFSSVLALVESLYRHATHILSFLPGTEVAHRSNADRDALLQRMGMEFTRAFFLQTAEEMGLKAATASTWLKRLAQHNQVESVDGKGTYRKITPTDV